MRLKYAAVLFIALSFLSCSRTSDVVEIQFWNFGGMPKFLEWVRKEVQVYNSTHPKVKVVLAEKSWHQIREILYAGFSAGAGPDIMTLHADHAAEFGAGGYFYPLNNFPDFEQVKARFDPHIMKSTKYNGNYYGLPSSSIVFILLCNKELFDKEGIAPPRTWSEFRAAAKRLTKDLDGDGAIDQYGFVLMGGDKGGFAYRFAPLLMRAGVQIMDPGAGGFDLSSPRAVAAVKLLADMNQIDHSITPGFLAYTFSDCFDLFCRNKVAMSIEGPWSERGNRGPEAGQRILLRAGPRSGRYDRPVQGDAVAPGHGDVPHQRALKAPGGDVGFPQVYPARRSRHAVYRPDDRRASHNAVCVELAGQCEADRLGCLRERDQSQHALACPSSDHCDREEHADPVHGEGDRGRNDPAGRDGRDRTGSPGAHPGGQMKRSTPYLLLAPALVFTGFILLFPLIQNLLNSVMRVTLTRGGGTWVGLGNYSNVLSDALFWLAFRNTIAYAVAGTVAALVIGLAFAVLLNARLGKFNDIMGFIYSIPWVVSPVVAGYAWKWLLNDSFGILNEWLTSWGIVRDDVNWLGDPHTAFSA